MNKLTTYSLAAGLLVLSLAQGCAQKEKTRTNVTFSKTTISTDFISEGSAVADVNKDGKTDILVGHRWYEAPDWKMHEISDGKVYDKKTYSNSFLNFTMDVDQDGWIDFIRIDHPGQAAYWYQNPQNQPGHWKEFVLHSSVGTENPLFVDVDGDGRLDIIGNDSESRQVIWLRSPSVKGDTLWTKYIISEDPDIATHKYTHGIGFGDLNGDGRKDVLVKQGWWEMPADPKQPNWKFHPANFGDDCAEMIVYDVNQDGLVDIISSSAHNYGIWWHEQGKDTEGNPTWTRHDIHTTISQTHSLKFEDINGDGIPDLVTGKRYFAHNGNDPGEFEPALIIWVEFKPGKNPEWIVHEADGDSGIGLQVNIFDMNKDNKPDIISGNKKGIHYLRQN